jgi:hypothetical protein
VPATDTIVLEDFNMGAFASTSEREAPHYGNKRIILLASLAPQVHLRAESADSNDCRNKYVCNCFAAFAKHDRNC